MTDDYFVYSRPVPGQVEEDRIPTPLFRRVLQEYEDKFPNVTERQFFNENATCPSHIRNVQPLGSVPTSAFTSDCVMPGFCSEHEYDIGSYYVGQVEICDGDRTWHRVALIVNEGDADCNSGHWGGAFVIQENDDEDDDISLRPLAWIRSVGDTETSVNQAVRIDEFFADLRTAPRFHIGTLDRDEHPHGLFGQGLRPGTCTTPVEKLVGAAYRQLIDEFPFPMNESADNVEGEDQSPSGGGGDDRLALRGMVFCITGALSMKRKEFVGLLESHGGSVKGTVTAEVTHLISARSDTAKAKKAVAKGVTILSEEQVVAMTKREDLSRAEREEQGSAVENGGGDGREAVAGQGLSGMVFAITGALSMKRADFVALIEGRGGVVKGSVTKEVTHLISSRSDTAKAKKAIENGVAILKEEDVMEMVGSATEKKRAVNLDGQPAKKKAKRKA